MTFLYPEFIYYFLPALSLLFIFVFRQRAFSEKHFTKEIMDKLYVNTSSLTLKQRNTLFLIVGVLLVIALAQPVLEKGKARVKSTSADLLIALDISDSMLARDVYPNRFELAKIKTLKLIEKATNDRIGVLAFASNSYLVSPISFDAKTVSFLVSKLDTQSITEKGTDILTMLESVAKTHTNTDKKYLLLLSDGGESSDFSREIEYAKEKKIVIFVLGMGTQEGVTIKRDNGSYVMKGGKRVIFKLNASISDLAIETGGVYIENSSSFEDIEVMLKKMTQNAEHKELKSQEIQRYTALFYYPIILAMIVLLIAFSSLVKRTQPNSQLSILILFAFFCTSSPSDAGYFDFLVLRDAKESYSSKDYKEASTKYEEYAKETHNGDAYYNAGNAYYKDRRYLQALNAYSQVRLENKELKANKLSNMGNAFVRIGTKKSLQKAIKHYEESLKIREDSFTRDNLNAVNKALEKNKPPMKKEQIEDQEKKVHSEQKSDEKDGTDASDDSNNNNRSKKSNNKNNSKNENENDTNSGNSKEKNNIDEGKLSAEGDAGEAQNKAQSVKDKTRTERNDGNGELKSSTQEMSNLEQKKWFKKLSRNQNTYLYKLNEEKSHKEEHNENPW